MNNFPENKYAKQYFDKLHAMPELGFNEIKTSRLIANELRQQGFAVTAGIGSTGIVAIHDTGVDGPVFGLRADMDALPFVVDGKDVAIHACGHDANCAMVLAASRMAMSKIKKGKFVLVFQQAEELSGALQMIEAYDFSFIDELVGIHLRPIAEAKLGEAMHALCHSASRGIKMTIKGKTAHGARPHLGVNAVEIAVAVINAINMIKEDSTVSHSIKVTQIASSGNPSNSIPDTVNVSFDCRAQTNEIMESITEKAKSITEHTVAMMGGLLEDFTAKGVIAAEYDEELTEFCGRSVVNILGSTLGICKTAGGEDFHYFGKLCGIKTAYIGIGANATPGLHSPDMTFDKRALDIGAAILADIVVRKLG